MPSRQERPDARISVSECGRMKFICAFICSAFAIQAQQTCPVAISKIRINGLRAALGSALAGMSTDTPPPPGTLYTIGYANTSSKYVMTVRFGISQYRTNSMLEIARSPDDFVTTDMRTLKPGKTSSVITNTGDQKLDFAWVEKVLFSDGTYWNDNGAHSCRSQVGTDSPKARKGK
jgi:hypothetical protein